MFTAILGPHVRRAGRPDAAAHPGTSRAWRPLRDGFGEAASDVAASSLEAFACIGTSGINSPPALRSRASIEIGGQTDEKYPTMDRGVSPFLGGELGSFGRLLKTTNHREKHDHKK